MADSKPESRALHDHCLSKIFRYLSLKDMKAVNGVCRQFRDVISDYNLHKYHRSVTHIHMVTLAGHFQRTNNNIPEYFKKFGHIIEHIDFTGFEHEVMAATFPAITANSYPNLKSCNISAWNEEMPGFDSLLQIFLQNSTTLASLSVSLCDGTTVAAIAPLQHLTEIRLNIMSIKNMQALHLLARLEKIESEHVDRLECSQFLLYSNSARTLRYLSFGCDLDEAIIKGLTAVFLIWDIYRLKPNLMPLPYKNQFGLDSNN